MKRTVSIALLIICLFSFVACRDSVDATGLWENATYTEDAEFGEGAKTVKVEVKVEEQMITFTIKTDKKTVGEALIENELISGDEGAYGLYVKKVNGILADYDVDKTYWGFYKNGEMMMVGVSQAEFADGESYELVLES